MYLYPHMFDDFCTLKVMEKLPTTTYNVGKTWQNKGGAWHCFTDINHRNQQG